MKENRIKIVTVVLVLCLGLLSACSNVGEEKQAQYKVVCTIFPEYDWVRELIGKCEENYQLTILMENGADLHNYQPTVEDLAVIGECDLFIYVGGESDLWVEDALKQVGNDKMQVINLLDVLGDTVWEEEIVEGMEHEHEEHEDQQEKSEHQEDEHQHGLDEHVWLSLKNAVIFAEEITDKLCTIDSLNQEIYEENYNNYIKKLNALDMEYQSVVEQAQRKTVLFGDRFPFRYIAEDYRLEYYAAFSGCSAETEASFETITFLAQKVDELELSSICIIDGSDGKIAETIVENTKDKNQDIVTMNSMQAVTKQDIENGITYLKIMKSNLDVLKMALN